MPNSPLDRHFKVIIIICLSLGSFNMWRSLYTELKIDHKQNLIKIQVATVFEEGSDM